MWEGVSVAEARGDKDGKLLNGRWVLCNKGDTAVPDCRARYVACEIATEADVSYFAATPPLEAKRLLMSQWASGRTRRGERLQLQFSDAKNAYVNGKPLRSLDVR